MQIILVSRGQKGPKTLDLSCRRLRCKMAAMVLAGIVGIAGVGAGIALTVASPRDRAMGDIHGLQREVGDQNAQVAQIKRDAQRDLDALAVKLGQLQAQSVRLNALGERLTQVGKLDDGEFNFDEEPGQGGPEVTTGAEPDAYTLPESLNKSIDQLSGQFDTQQAQLEALRDMLMDRSIESSLRPTGMPVNGYISSYFGGRPDPFSGHSARHTGIDIATPTGTPVTAVAEGMVTFAGQRSGYGDVIEIDHGNGYMTRYAHNSALVARPGQRVRVGDVIAKAGSTGRSTGSHVHFEVWYHDKVVNPLAFVRSHR
ncbi:MAG: M23 family metallopeptidase [Luteibacter sp.]|uniref:M23 family metallopeptidase n=1 Tax=Luteibacter TaxID=242605 RepID=UPI000569A04C|nr:MULTISPECIES: M23 family metallopeptidase [unclassified Luteibacter]MDQ7997842.1 M23 family metallopeptidase [Luteibacter sp.]MDQ8050415.1 M23 family metallopeptidase [Luteibacter sp.]SKB32490.1 Membrane proteins related to metalloendopeptidases [Luteibacter sp. 22Crub2.1]